MSNENSTRTAIKGVVWFIVILVSLILVLRACIWCGDDEQKTATTKAKYSVSAQNTLDSLSCVFNHEFKNAANSIKKDEINKEYLKKYKDFFNSISKIDRWEGKIFAIKEEKGDIEVVDEKWILSKQISFVIEMENSDRTAKIYINCRHKFSENDAENDVVFNAIKDIADYSKVYVSGDVMKYSDGETAFYYEERLNGFVLGLNPTKIEIQE